MSFADKIKHAILTEDDKPQEQPAPIPASQPLTSPHLVTACSVISVASVSDDTSSAFYHVWLLGRDRDADGRIIPGARIQENYSLVDLGLCWQDQIQTRPDFVEFVRGVKERFRTL